MLQLIVSKNTRERLTLFETVCFRVCQSMLHQQLLGILQQEVLPPCPGTERGQGKPLHTHRQTDTHTDRHTHRVSTMAGRSIPVCAHAFPVLSLGCGENEKCTVGLQSLPEQLKERRGQRPGNAFYVCGFSGFWASGLGDLLFCYL